MAFFKAKKRYKRYQIATIQEKYTYYVDEPVYETRTREVVQPLRAEAWVKGLVSSWEYVAYMRDKYSGIRADEQTGVIYGVDAISEQDAMQLPVGGSLYVPNSREVDGKGPYSFGEFRRDQTGYSIRTWRAGVTNEYYQVQVGTRKVAKTGTRPKRVRGAYVDTVVAVEGAWPDDGEKNGYWYEKQTSSLSLTGASDLGMKTGDFHIRVGTAGFYPDTVPTLRAAINGGTTPFYETELQREGDHWIRVKSTDYSSLSFGQSMSVYITLSDGVEERDLTVRFSKGNTVPVFTSSDPVELGAKNAPFQIRYKVDDNDGGTVQVRETLNGAKFGARDNVTAGAWNTISISASDLAKITAGRQNTIEVTATDRHGGISQKQWYFTRANSAPTISGSDGDLGAKNDAFSVTYTVNDTDTSNVLKVTETLNQVPIRTVSNVSRGQEQRITIDRTKLLALPLNAQNTLEVKVEDDAGGVAYRRWTFTRSNSAPTISGSDGDLGSKTAPFSVSFTPTDPERDAMTAVLYLDEKILKDFKAVSNGATQTFTFDKMSFAEVEPNTPHRLRFVVRDAHGAEATQTKTFTRALTELSYVFKKNTDQKVTKAIVTPTWHLGTGAVGKVEVCNNANDASPRWEVMTTQALEGRHFNLTNTSKTASSWAFGVRVTITKGQAKSWLGGFGGAYQ